MSLDERDQLPQLLRLAERAFSGSQGLIDRLAAQRSWFAAVVLSIGSILILLAVVTEVLAPGRLGGLEFVSLLAAGSTLSSAAPLSHAIAQKELSSSTRLLMDRALPRGGSGSLDNGGT
jgi:hypothetical protein